MQQVTPKLYWITTEIFFWRWAEFKPTEVESCNVWSKRSTSKPLDDWMSLFLFNLRTIFIVSMVGYTGKTGDIFRNNMQKIKLYITVILNPLYHQPMTCDFFYPPSSGISSCVRTVDMVMCLHTWHSPVV